MLQVAIVTGLLACVCQAEQIELFMPQLRVDTEDAYMCKALKMPVDKSVYITGFEPKADMSVSHHILLYGCEEAGDESGKPFSCTQMDHSSDDAKPTCAKGSTIIYAWAMGAPSFQLPEDVAFKVGKDTKLKTLVLQMHFKYNGTFNGGSGLRMTAQEKPTPFVAGIYLMATGGIIPPKSIIHLETMCEFAVPITLQPFAYRVHTHTFGLVVAGYRVRDDEWSELGRKNPQLPQMFYQISDPELDIQEGDVLAARCTMKNSGSREVMIGATKNDEMCNFYVMYAMPNTAESQAAVSKLEGCFGYGLPYERSEMLRDFGISTGFPAESSVVPASDKQLAKTMGDHMQMQHSETAQMDEMDDEEMQMGGESEMENDASVFRAQKRHEMDGDSDE